MEYLKYLYDWIRTKGWTLKAKCLRGFDEKGRPEYEQVTMTNPWQFYKEKRELNHWKEVARAKAKRPTGPGIVKFDAPWLDTSPETAAKWKFLSRRYTSDNKLRQSLPHKN